MIRLRLAALSILAASTVLGVANLAHAATTGTIQGLVKDEATGKALAGVSVVVSGPALQQEQTEFTDSGGRYIISELPVGEYVVRFYFSNVKVERPGVVLTADKTLTVNADIPTAQAKTQTYRIVEKSPTVDTGNAQVQTSITDDLVKNIPVGSGGFRTFESVLTLAPGAAADDVGVSFGGATGPENNFLIEGLNTTDPAFGLVGSSLSLEFVRETELITAGYAAEYGRATGGVVNVVTKSGSNEFHGSAFFNYQPFRLQPARGVNATDAITVQGNFKNAFDFGASIGGPIVKDRIWFYAGFNPQIVTYTADRIVRTRTYDNLPASMTGGSYSGDVTTNTSCPAYLSSPILCNSQRSFVFQDLPQYTKTYDTTTKTYFIDAKLDFQINENNSASIEYFGNPGSTEGALGSYAGPERGLLATSSAQSHDFVASFNSKLLERKLLIEARIGYHLQLNPPLEYADPTAGMIAHATDIRQTDLTTFEPNTMADCAPKRIHGVNVRPCTSSFYSDGGWGGNSDLTLSRIAATASATYFARLGGTHAVRLGGDFEDNLYDDKRWLTGGAAFTVNSDGSVQRTAYATIDPTTHIARLLPEGFHAATTTLNESMYLRDSWNVGFVPGLTLNLGLRWELQQIQDINGTTQISLTDNIAPRLGVVYDFTHKGLGKVYASYGRFYESIPLDINDRQFSGEGQAIQTVAGGNCNFGSKKLNVTDYKDTCQFPNVTRADINGGTFANVAPNLKGMYSNEYTAGVQYDVGLDLVVGAAYIHRDLGRIVEDISPDGGLNYIVTNPGEPTDPGVVSDLQRQIGDLDKQIGSTTNPSMKQALTSQRNMKTLNLQLYQNVATWELPKRDYNAFAITANKRLSHNFVVLASYTYSRTTGNYPGLYQASNGQLDPNISSQYDLKELVINRNGPLPNDHPHNLKLDGAYLLPLGGNRGTVTLGGTFNVISGVPIEVLGRHPTYGFGETFILARGSGGRTPTLTSLNLRAAYQRSLGKTFKLMLSWDVFNVLDTREVTAVDENYTFDNVLPIVNGNAADVRNIKTTSGVAATPNSNYGRPVAYQAPLSMKFGLRLDF